MPTRSNCMIRSMLAWVGETPGVDHVGDRAEPGGRAGRCLDLGLVGDVGGLEGYS